MIAVAQPELHDRSAREEALDTTKSFLVQAPAGSGKTELLSMRFLKLLAVVEEPEQVLAITFTNAATAEMRHRVISRLEEAKHSHPGAADSSVDMAVAIASAALNNSEHRGWRLLEQPQRLNIQTIDSLCLRVAHRMPLRARLGGTLQPTENSFPLYRRAARRTFDHLGGKDEELNHALKGLLILRDGNLGNCETLLAGMLQTRDQWSSALPLSGEVQWPDVKARLEKPFEREITRVLAAVRLLLCSHPGIAQELCELTAYALENIEAASEGRAVVTWKDLPPATADCLAHWHFLCDLLLTKDNEPRKTHNRQQGFPPKGKEQKKRIAALMQKLGNLPALLNLFRDIRELPTAHYTDEQWQTLRHIFTMLRFAIIELETVFAEQDVVDFTEIAQSASEILRGENLDGLLITPRERIQHLLVDEFQDTSRRQHELIASLLHGWTAGDGRTFFLVGDPMQSIYMFRQADVELFKVVGERGLTTAGGGLAATRLQLTTNFRSNAGVVDPLNAMFQIVFPHEAKVEAASIDFLAGVADNREMPKGAYTIHPSFILPRKRTRDAVWENDTAPSPAIEARQREAAEVVSVIRRHLARVEEAQEKGEEFTIAVLGRAKDHLASIAAALREEDIAFRAVDLEWLSERQEILDLESLTRALLHPMDRIAWLSLLRAPWCGLELRDLHLLCGTDDQRHPRINVLQQVRERLHLVGPEPRRRVERLFSVMQAAFRHRDSYISFSLRIERTWRSLGGPACVDRTGYENALAYFRMLEKVSPDGIAATGEEMEDQLGRLFAKPDPAVSERCGIQLMTIHKAKGLGFNVVVLPGLHRPSGRERLSLIRYLERSTPEDTETLVAPIGAKGDKASRLENWVRRQKENRETEERKRLLYVACTRAREELHLFATATVTKEGLSPGTKTLLGTAWPAVSEVFHAKCAKIDGLNGSASDNVVEFASFPVQGQLFSGGLDSVAAVSAPSFIRRLPLNWKPEVAFANVTVPIMHATALPIEQETPRHRRPEASPATRTLGTVVHAIFERATLLLEKGSSAGSLLGMLPSFQAHAAALARNDGLTLDGADWCAKQAAAAFENTLSDPIGTWILSPHPEAQSEASWTGILDGVPKTLRVDRSFLAGHEPLSEGEDILWIVDYKTATHSGAGLSTFLKAERQLYVGQLEVYSRVLRLARGEGCALRLALYYPLLRELVSWPG